MIQSFIVISIILIILLLGYSIYIHIKKINYSSKIITLYTLAALTLIANLGIVLSKKEFIAGIFYALYLALTTWLVVVFIKLCFAYANKLDLYKKYKIKLIILTIIDSIFLLSNIIFNHAFYLEKVLVKDIEIFTICYKTPYYLHLIYVYLISFILIIKLIKKILKSKGLEKNKYVALLIPFAAIIVSSIVFHYIPAYIDYSVIVYSFLAFSISFFVEYYVPLKMQNNIKKLLIDNMQDSVIGCDLNGNIIYTNAKVKQLFTEEEIKKLYERCSKRYELLGFHTYSLTEQINNSFYEINFEKVLDKKGHYFANYFIIRDRTGEILKDQKQFKEITHDTLTDIYNKEYFIYETAKLLKNTKKDYYMIYTDIKNFKLINNYYGYQSGDHLIKSIAEHIKSLYDNNLEVTYGRINNDNFAVCLPKEAYDENKAKKYLELFKKKYKDFNTFLYIGIYKIVDKNLDISIMLDNASIAVSQIKNEYKTFINYYDEQYKTNIIEEATIVNTLDESLKHKDFEIFIQPQVTAFSNEVKGGEALVRWKKDGKYMTPSKFIPVLERTGLISKLDLYVWQLSCQKLSEWKKNGKEDFYLSINISPDDIKNIDVYKELCNLIKKYNISPNNLKLEITESVFAENKDNLIKLIDKLKSKGFSIEIDDFGSGYSSLNLLKDINLDVVKMDMNFLQGKENIDKSKIILSNLVNLCKDLKLTVISEGVETKEQKDILDKLGVDFYQGYYFDKPLSIKDFEEKYMEDKNG